MSSDCVWLNWIWWMLFSTLWLSVFHQENETQLEQQTRALPGWTARVALSTSHGSSVQGCKNNRHLTFPALLGLLRPSVPHLTVSRSGFWTETTTSPTQMQQELNLITRQDNRAIQGLASRAHAFLKGFTSCRCHGCQQETMHWRWWWWRRPDLSIFQR